MNGMENVWGVVGGLIAGIMIGILIGIYIHETLVKKALKTRCRDCEHFAECQGMNFKQLDKKNNCKVFKKKTVSKEVKAMKLLAEELQSLSDDVDSLYSIASDNDNAIQDLAKKVFDKNEEVKVNGKKNAKHR